MKKLRVSLATEKKIKKGQLLLEKKDFPHLDLDHQLVDLMDQRGQFLARAYLSPQNKGVGWVFAKQALDLDVAFFRALFEQAKAKRQSYRDDAGTTAYRLFNQEGDGFAGFSVDLYGDYALFSWYNLFVFEQREKISQAFRAVFPEVLGAYEKIRFKGPAYESAHLYGQAAPESFTILENGIRYSVFLNDGLMTGIFLDQHDVRASLSQGLATGKRVLNMFSYTAAFSVAAAMGGALETTSVDLAKRSRDLSQAHFLENGLSLDHHQFVVMDVFAYFKYAKRHGLVYDLIILDPPSFARNKKETFSVAKDYHRLIAQALDILAEGGLIVASTNAANLSRQKFKKELDKGFAGVKYHFLVEWGLPADFTYNKKDESSNYLKVFTIKVNQ
ncbi:class I SAM-dependent rRNA methyltransferase [Streptococcus oricebi]|uniref:Class I SAM-dependent rRNA methyltransferase n=1 Tax=Streptococcus oricebi TaxID=1547447 RepID=A0ABS5B2G1_9STRE|nr:class I SAM-dependent rRNA methyltransferase [Streptococcus oricebi]MBP2623026.1 hypothetical protein [Streptococcus oricebi]